MAETKAVKSEMENMDTWDVTVIVTDEDGEIINGNKGVMKSLSSKLGIGKLGFMKLGK